MPQPRYDPFMGGLPPPAQDPQEIQQQPAQRPGNPMDDILAQMIQKNLGATPPPDRPLSQWEIFAGMTNPALMEMVLARKQDTPEARQYAQGQRMLPTMIQAQGQRQNQQATESRFQQNQSRLDQMGAWRRQMQSQWKPETRQEFDVNTGTNRFHTVYRDPRNNNQIVDDEWTDYAPIHMQNYAGAGGENVQAPTSPMPQGPPPTRHQGAPGGPNIGGDSPANVRPTPTGRPHQAPAGVTQDAARATSFVQALAPVFGAWREAKKSVSDITGTGIAGTAGQLAVDRAAQTQGVRAFLPFAIGHESSQSAINYKQKQKIALYNYVKQQTGAQFSVSEMDRYESMFPRIEDTEQTAINSLSNLAQKAVNDINAMKAQWHAIQTPNGQVYVAPDFMDEFMTGGGMQPEMQPTDPAEAILNRYLEKKRGQQRR